ncbi:tRNA (N6-threonylcarbamoyladenosine(37)-N6)-methyltransferase TrmO [Butyrivibrio sp. X503]|uniref:TrmO family methyltransferase domain-containing protein n=1 Tax=Butyrivibrio sp. X503 TaxID=2364878 RepID=UPI000EAA575B|nr:TrmO family methyltransferase [Butyrivibrio sp. X503]RKM55750.1 tRNA (N6-threonylcarbamoyladenosine(37)-N6)-methyltransferase TrmO [Butyrivibrio sp. X503]
MKIEMKSIGYVRNEVKDRKDVSWGEDTSSIVLEKQYYSGLKGLEDFSHVIILYHLDKAKFEKDKHLQRRPQNREDKLVVKGLDAVDGTPVLDIKPYYPVYDKKDASVPEWVDRLMEHYF